MNAFVDWVAYWLADFYLAAMVLLAAALGAMAVCRQPAKRLAVAKAVIVALALLAWLCVLPGWSLISLEWAAADTTADVSNQPRSMEVTPAALAPVVEVGGVVEAAPAVLPSVQSAPVAIGPSVSWLAVLVAVYLAGCGLMVVWLLLGVLAAGRLVRRAEPASMELADELRAAADGGPVRVELLVTREIDVAAAIGVLRPRVLLPQGWSESRSSDELRAVLAHELAHVRNGDLRWLAASRLLLVLLWAQPLYWWLRRQMRLDQESLADAAAAERTGNRQYAEQLVAWARDVGVRPRPLLPASVGLWEGASQLRLRVAVLLDEKLTVLRQCSQTWAIASVGTAAAAALILSFATFEPSMAKTSKGATEDSAGIRKSPAGIEVRIVGIGDDVPAGQSGRWWNADGTLFDSAPLDVGQGSLSLNDDQEARKLIFQVIGASSDPTIRWNTVDLVGGAYLGTPVVNGKEHLPGLCSYVFTIKKGQADFGLRVDFADGEWKTALQSVPTKGNAVALAGGKSLDLGEGFQTTHPNWGPYWRDVATVRLKLNFNDQAVRVVAIDSQGKLHPPGRTTTRTSVDRKETTAETESYFLGLPLAKVQRFEVQVRDFESVEFTDLPSQPDAERPAVQFVEIETEAAETEHKGEGEKRLEAKVIGNRFVLCPVTTELQRSLLGSSDQSANDASACVFANFGALEGVELVESSPAFAELSRELARYAKYDDRHLFFRVVVSESRPISDIQKSVEELSRFGELLGKRAGYRKVKRTQTFQGSLDFDWNEYVDRARRLAVSSVELSERAVGDDRVQVYAVSTFLSHLLVQADCVVNILPTVKNENGRRFPEGFQASMAKFIPQLKFERMDEMLCRVRFVDSAEERLREWIENLAGRKVFASQFGFRFCNVEMSGVGESDEEGKNATPSAPK